MYKLLKERVYLLATEIWTDFLATFASSCRVEEMIMRMHEERKGEWPGRGWSAGRLRNDGAILPAQRINAPPISDF